MEKERSKENIKEEDKFLSEEQKNNEIINSEDYLEELLELSSWLEEHKDDPHVKSIILDEIDRKDLEIFKKFQKGILTEEELKAYQQEYLDEFAKAEKKMNKSDEEIQKEFLNDSRASLQAMILNKMLSQKAAEMLRKNFHHT
jgi:hypothetical protein